MNITRESTGELTAIVKIEIEPEDYSVAVDKVIHDYKRKSNIPGFRPGHIPTGLIKKMYGKAILAEEINKLLSDSLMKYIKDEKLDILGNPLPSKEKNAPADFENQTRFDFFFDLGFAPEFTLPFSRELEIEHFTIEVDDKMIDKYVQDTRMRYGKPLTTENPEGGNPDEKKEPEIIPAELNTEFFTRVYPGQKIDTEEEFREQVRKDAINGFAAETEKLFYHNATEALVMKTNIQLPDTFLKRWILENNEGKYTDQDVEKEYDSFAGSMKWQLIENKLIKEYHIEVKEEDIRNYIRTNMLRQMTTENPDPEIQKKYETIVDAFMQNKEQVQRINDQLYHIRILELFKANLGIVMKEVSYDEFIKLASASHNHEQDHQHEHDHGVAHAD
jgi:FKBP-type peptidyl-prolyl cis-trans isomerase (trigger factor)